MSLQNDARKVDIFYFFLYKIFKYDVFKRLKTHIKPDCYLFYFKIKSSLVTCVGRKLARHTRLKSTCVIIYQLHRQPPAL